ncbi:MAG: PAS domain-containing protein, partial [Candidatus Acidiferrales bacterium]
MELTASASEWLPWLGRVRFLIITFLLAVVVVVHQFTPVTFPIGVVVSLCGIWYVFASLYVILQRALPHAGWHGALQMVLDVSLITGVVYSSGAQDSYFVSLYLLAILMGSILFSRRGAFMVAGFAFILLGCAVEMMFYGLIPRFTPVIPAARTLETWLASNLFAFFAVAYLGSLLTQTIHKKGAELEQKSEALKNLQAFNQDIIESMRGGLLTTDIDGRILLINRAGVEITGHGFGLMRGENVADALPGFWPVEVDESGNPLALRKEIEFITPAGETRFLGISISPL